MRTLIKRTAALALCLVLCLTLLPTPARAYTQTGDQAEDIVAYAESMDGQRAGDKMCAAFVCEAAEEAGMDSSQINLRATVASPWVGSGQFGFLDSSGNTRYGCLAYTWKDFLEGSYSPCKGDLVFYGYFTDYSAGTASLTIKEAASKDYYHVHVGIIRNNSSTTSKLYTIDGGQKDPNGQESGYYWVSYKDRPITASSGYAWKKDGHNIYVLEFIRPDYHTTNPSYSVYYYKNLSGKNYLLNTDFTGSLDPEYYESRDTSVAAISIDSSTKHNNYNSLKIVNSSAGSDGKDLSIQTTTRRNAVQDGYVGDSKSMILSFWAKSSKDGTKAYFRWGFQDSYRSVTLSTSWQKYTVRMDKTTAYGSYIHPYMDSAGTVWLSELQLEDGTSATDFVPETGGLYTTARASEGGSYPLPSISASGYSFQGWYTEAKGGTQVTSSTAVRQGHTCLYAHWAPPSYNVYYYKNLSGKNYLLNTDFTGSLDPEYYDSRNTSVATISIDSATKHNNYNSLKVVNSSAGSSGKDLSIQTTTRRNAVEDGYVGDSKSMVLSFWAKSSKDGTKAYFRWGFQDSYRSVTLSTSWQKYTVSMDKTTAYGGYIHPYMDSAGTVWLSELQLEDGTSATDFVPETGGLYTTAQATYGGSYQLPSISQSGYSFQGWYTEAKGGTQVTSSTAVQRGHTCFYAHWGTNTYTVSYDANGGTGAPEAQTKIPGVALTLSSAEPTRAATSGSYTVTLDPNGGSVDPTSLTAAWTNEYSFSGWNTASDGRGKRYVPGASYTEDRSRTLYAMWNVSKSTDAVTLPTPTRPGFAFNGWAADANASEGTVGEYTPAGNVTLYALWTENTADTYTVSYDANGGSGAPAAQTKTQGQALTLSSTRPTRADASTGSYTVTLDPAGGSVSPTSLTAAKTTKYTFRNWNTQSNGSGTSYSSGGNYTADASATLYAQWDSTTTTAAVTLPTPTREGWTFKGWSLDAAASSGIQGSYTPVNSVTLYAIWSENSAPPQSLFTDVTNPEDYFYEAVYWAKAKNITSGKTPTTFEPYPPCTRGQIVTFLWRMMGEPEPYTMNNPFSDVKSTDYFYKPVLWAYHSGITSGKTATTFGPYQPCTREQCVTFLWRAADKPSASVGTQFKDVKRDAYYAEAVYWALANKITTGQKPDAFGVGNKCTRGQIVTFLYRYAKLTGIE